jgi:signal transduction histidine kinase
LAPKPDLVLIIDERTLTMDAHNQEGRPILLRRLHQVLVQPVKSGWQRARQLVAPPVTKGFQSIRQGLGPSIARGWQRIRQSFVAVPITRRLRLMHRYLAPRIEKGMQGFRRYLGPPVIEGSYEKTRIAEFVNTVFIVFILNSAALAILAPFISLKSYSFIAILVILVLLRHGAIFIMRRGWVLMASLILTVALWAAATFLVLASGGVNSPHLLTYLSVVLIAGLVVGGRGGILFALLSVALTLGISFLTIQHRLPRTALEIQTPQSIWVVLAINLIIVAMFQYMAWSSLHRALDRANQLAQEATEANTYKTRLIARVSHELRSPLGAILGITEMMNCGALGPTSTEQHDATERVLNNTKYLQRLVGELLDQSRIEAGQITLEEVEFSPAEVARRVHSLLLSKAQEKKLTLTLDVDSCLPSTLVGDPTRIEQILFNLVNNAIKFTEKGSVDVKAYLSDQGATHEWALQVTDTGIGIPPDMHARIFEPFSQVDDSPARKHGGVGLGLAIVQQLVKLLEGRINLKSEVGRGSTFTVFLPLIVYQPSLSTER